MSIQEIGMNIDLSKGEFVNTEFNSDNKLQLIELGKTIDGAIIYAENGSWTSEVIRLKDKFKSFKNFVKTVVGDGEYKVFTRSSLDSFVWSNWEEINYETGNIISPLGLFAKIKIEVTANNSESPVEVLIEDFDDTSKFGNDYIDNSNNYLRLKKKYTYIMNDTENENIYVQHVEKTKFKKIDKIRIGVN